MPPWHYTWPFQSHWLYPLCCTLRPCDYFVTANLQILLHPPRFSPKASFSRKPSSAPWDTSRYGRNGRASIWNTSREKWEQALLLVPPASQVGAGVMRWPVPDKREEQGPPVPQGPTAAEGEWQSLASRRFFGNLRYFGNLSFQSVPVSLSGQAVWPPIDSRSLWSIQGVTVFEKADLKKLPGHTHSFSFSV